MSEQRPIVERLQRCIDNCEETTIEQDALAHILEQDNEIERLTAALEISAETCENCYRHARQALRPATETSDG